MSTRAREPKKRLLGSGFLRGPVQLAAKLLAIRREKGESDDGLPKGIELRRFAGPAAHSQQLSRPLRIAHLTDIHVGRVTPMKVQRHAVALANAEKPDLVVITGDFVCHSQEYLDALEEVLRGLSAPVVGV